MVSRSGPSSVYVGPSNVSPPGIIEPTLLGRARAQRGDTRLVRLVAGIKAAAPTRNLQQIASQLESMRERTPRGGTRWHLSSVKYLLSRAERLRIMPQPRDEQDSTLGL